MGLINCDYEDFYKITAGKEIVCYGVGKMLQEAEEEFKNTPIEGQIIKLTDGNLQHWGAKRKVFGKEIEILPPQKAFASVNDDTVFLITSGACMEIIPIITSCVKESIQIFIFPFMRSLQNDRNMLKANNKKIDINNTYQKIPKKIHYTWFSGEELPDNMKKCKESWKKYCPDYEIIEWNRNNYDIEKIPYMKQAIEQKKWGFAGDYARLDIMYEQGGIYLDLDVELVKSLDELLVNDAYAGFESERHVNFGSGFGARPKFPLLKEMMKEYEKEVFCKEDGSLNLTASPVYQTRVLNRYGLKEDGTFQCIEGMTIYPFEYLCAQSIFTGNVYQTENTFSIHRFAASWVDSEITEKREEKLKLLREISI